MISIERVYNQLEQQPRFISVVELAIMLEANTSEVRQRLYELGDRVTRNEQESWAGSMKQLLCLANKYRNLYPQTIPKTIVTRIVRLYQLANRNSTKLCFV